MYHLHCHLIIAFREENVHLIIIEKLFDFFFFNSLSLKNVPFVVNKSFYILIRNSICKTIIDL